MTFAAGDTVTLDATRLRLPTAQIVVGSGGLLKASGTAFNASIGSPTAASHPDRRQLRRPPPGQQQHLRLSYLNLDHRRRVQRRRPVVGNGFDLPLYIPAIDVQYLSGSGNNNLRFQTSTSSRTPSPAARRSP